VPAKLRRMILRELLRAKNVRTPSEFARRMGISRQHGWLLWHGMTLPSLDTVRKLRDVFGLDPRDLAELELALPRRKRRRSPKQRPPEMPPEGNA
jgi:transcriptional regulator with XRE-family HTH domain